MANAVTKYLRRHAEPEATLADELPWTFDHALTVPIYGEDPDALPFLELPSDRRWPRLLLCLTLNGRQDSDPEVLRVNRALPPALCSRYGPAARLGQGAQLWETEFGVLLLLDRSRPDRLLPASQGVGLARKIGADVALAVHARGHLRSPFIGMTDADARLPPEHFNVMGAAQSEGVCALVHPFVHRTTGGSSQAAAAYECRLRAHVLGLASAGSPYAFHTIGSTLSVSAQAYAGVRGVPRRHGAEDFYLLNKLAKLGIVRRLGGTPIELQGRVSDRVPFGTGPSLARLQAGEPLRLYDPGVYPGLGAVLETLDELSKRPDRDWRSLLEPPAGVSREVLLSSLTRLSLDRAAHHASSLPHPGQRARALHTFFDAFRSLKLVHMLREAGMADVPLAKGVAALPQVDPQAPARVLACQLAQLEQERARGPTGVPARASTR